MEFTIRIFFLCPCLSKIESGCLRAPRIPQHSMEQSHHNFRLYSALLFGWFEQGPPSSGLSQQLWGQEQCQDANLPQAALPGDHLSFPGAGRGGKRDLPNSWGDNLRSPEMVPEQQETFVAEVRKEMWWRTETDQPWPQQRCQELFTGPVLGRHHDFGMGIEVLFKLTSISASSCHFQSREIQINWTAARQALESHKWFVRAFLLGGHNEPECI